MKKIVALLNAFVIVLTLLVFGPGVVQPAKAADNVEKNAVAYMDITFKCGCRQAGTGTMIAVNGMITAAHNLVCSTHNQDLKSCIFYFNRKGNNYFYKYSGAISFTWYSDFSNGYSSEDDIGYIVFPKDIGKTTGWYASSVESDSSIESEFCHVWGYDGSTLCADWNQVKVVSSREIAWPISSVMKGCAGGGPVYYGYEGLEFPVLVAVYTSHSASGSNGYARRFTEKIFNDMKKSGVKFN